jgi:hypothetical protein
MNKIVIAYHCYLFGDKYKDMIVEQFRLLLSSGLYQASSLLYIGVAKSEKQDHKWIEDFWRFGSTKELLAKDNPKVKVVAYEKNNEETDTLKWVRDYSVKNANDYVLYFHTKGITQFSKATEDWRHYMEYFTIEKWKDCVAKLKENYSCCGVLWNKDTPVGDFPHFSGGFWWATTNYIQTLDHSYLDSGWRYHREFWIGSNKKCRPFEFHNSRLNDKASLIACKGHYNSPYPRNNYAIDNILHVICTAYERPIHLRMMVDNFLIQTCENWKLTIVYDGPAPQSIKDVMRLSLNDYRVNFIQTPERTQCYGHLNRKKYLQEIKGSPNDFVLITNEDNQYTPTFVEYFLKETAQNVGMVYCVTIHSYLQYKVLRTQIKENFIDMGSFIVRLDVAQSIGFNHTHVSADGRYAVECLAECEKRGLIAVKINKAIFIHN